MWVAKRNLICWMPLIQLENPLSVMPEFRSVSYPVRVHAGTNALARLADEAERLRAGRVLVVCGQTVGKGTDLVERAEQSLGDKFAGVYDGVRAGSPLPSVEQGVEMAARTGADLLVALGGGSAVVTTRAIVILLAEGGRGQDHATKYPPGKPPVSPRLMKAKIPNVVVATTPTTATNRAGAAVIDPETGHRLELFDPKTRPAAVIWDEQALLTAPPGLCLSAAASCYSGVVGGLQSLGTNPLTEGDLLQAMRLLSENLPLINAEPDNGAVRLNLSVAAFLMNRSGDTRGGGAAGSMAVVGSLAHALDTRYPECDHGSAYSILTAPGMRFNRSHNTDGQARLAQVMGIDTRGMDDVQAATAAADEVERIYREVGLPWRLRDVGVDKEGVRQIAEDAMTDFGLHRNIRPVSDVAELEELLQEAW